MLPVQQEARAGLLPICHAQRHSPATVHAHAMSHASTKPNGNFLYIQGNLINYSLWEKLLTNVPIVQELELTEVAALDFSLAWGQGAVFLLG